MKKTIKELADELGVSKQAIQKRVNNLPINQQPTKVGGKYLLSETTSDLIRLHYKSYSDSYNNEDQPRNDKVVDNGLSDVVADLKADKVELFNSLKEKDKQIASMQKLLDQQQVLTLQANKKIAELETTLTDFDSTKEEDQSESEPQKKSFWSKLFG